MKDILKLGGILGGFSILAAAILALVNGVTKPLIEAQRILVVQEAVSLALPTAKPTLIRPIPADAKEPLFFVGMDSTDSSKIAGYAFVAVGKGYSSNIRTMVGVDTSMKIVGLKVLSQAETPGLGTKVEEIKYGEKDPWFLRQLIGRAGLNLAVQKDGGQVQAITGATISSRALTKSIVVGINQLKQNLAHYPIPSAKPDSIQTFTLQN